MKMKLPFGIKGTYSLTFTPSLSLPLTLLNDDGDGDSDTSALTMIRHFPFKSRLLHTWKGCTKPQTGSTVNTA